MSKNGCIRLDIVGKDGCVRCDPENQDSVLCFICSRCGKAEDESEKIGALAIYTKEIVMSTCKFCDTSEAFYLAYMNMNACSNCFRLMRNKNGTGYLVVFTKEIYDA